MPAYMKLKGIAGESTDSSGYDFGFTSGDDAETMALLLPAVQAARESARGATPDPDDGSPPLFELIAGWASDDTVM